LATGWRAPLFPDLPGLNDVGLSTPVINFVGEEFAKFDEAPKRLVVLGGGPIGSELATKAFARLGSR